MHSDSARDVDASSYPFSTDATNERGQPLYLPDDAQLVPPPRTISAITLGAGARGNVYGNFALAYPRHLKVVGVAEPDAVRRDGYGERHGIAPDARFHDWEEVFRRPKFADAIIVSTPDQLHFAPCMAALEAGYDVLLEKPIAPTEAECRALLDRARASGRIVAVCHVLRYAPYFAHMRRLIRSGAVGRLVSIQHMEPIGHVHMAHSYVRGNWRRSDAHVADHPGQVQPRPRHPALAHRPAHARAAGLRRALVVHRRATPRTAARSAAPTAAPWRPPARTRPGASTTSSASGCTCSTSPPDEPTRGERHPAGAPHHRLRPLRVSHGQRPVRPLHREPAFEDDITASFSMDGVHARGPGAARA